MHVSGIFSSPFSSPCILVKGGGGGGGEHLRGGIGAKGGALCSKMIAMKT